MPAVATAQVSTIWSSSLRAQLLAPRPAAAAAPATGASGTVTSASEGPQQGDGLLQLRAVNASGLEAAASTRQGSGWKLQGISARLPLAALEQDDTVAAGGAALGSRVVYQSAVTAALSGSNGRQRRWLRPGAIVRVAHYEHQQAPGRGPRAATDDAAHAATGSSAASSPAGVPASPTCATARTYLVQALYRDQLHGVKNGGEPMAQLRVLLPGRDTVLEDAAAEHELFLLDTTAEGADADTWSEAEENEGGEGTRVGAITGTSGLFEPRSGSTDRSRLEARRLARLRPEETLVTLPLSALDAAEVLRAKDLSSRPCDHTHRLENAQADLHLQRSNARGVAAGLPPTYIYRHVYCPRQGLFRSLRREQLRLGQWIDPQQLAPAAAFGQVAAPSGSGQVPLRLPSKDVAAAAELLPDGSGFTLAGATYKVGEFMYVDPREAGGQEGEPWAVVQLAAVTQQAKGHLTTPGAGGGGGKGRKKAPSLQLTVHRFLRPEDVCPEQAHAADWWDLLAPPPPPPPSAAASDASSCSSATCTSLLCVPVSTVAGKCAVVVAGAQQGPAAGPALPGVRALDTFRVVGSALPPPRDRPEAEKEDQQAGGGWLRDLWAAAAAAGNASSAGTFGRASAATSGPLLPPPVRPLATLDIFAGCGGLSEGLHQSGVSSTLWAVEYEENAAAAYQLNNPQTAVLAGDCNALLQAAMVRAGQARNCVVNKAHAPAEAVEAEAAATKNKRSSSAAAKPAAQPPLQPQPPLPQPGEVELLVGGPPCQGFSGLNRHPGSDKAVRNNSLVGSYLSYCDFYRPRYFILENVMGFVLAQPVQPTEGGLKSRQRRVRIGSRHSSSGTSSSRSSGSSTPSRGNDSGSGSGADDGPDWSSGAESEGENELQDGTQSEPEGPTSSSSGGASFTGPASSPSTAATIAAGPAACRVNYFKLAVRTLLDMGYQVRFGALNAGNHGVPQSRKRVFIIAALPDELLPNWPRPLHAFRVAAAAGQNREGQQDQPLIQLPGGCYFANGAGQRLAGTPLRAVTVRDAIGNLPPIAPGTKGSSAVPLPAPVSAFQRRLAEVEVAEASHSSSSGHVSGVEAVSPPAHQQQRQVQQQQQQQQQRQLTHHVLEQPLGERHRDVASFVPPGMDFSAVLSDKAAAAAALAAATADDTLGSGSALQSQQKQQQYEAQLEALKERYPQLESRSARSGFYGRLSQSGYFRTAITNPRVESSTGWSLHPDTSQQRSVSVREVARSQGFPDHHVFGGRTEACYRQVGNAVPPPLALALGLQLRQALQQAQRGRVREEPSEGAAERAHMEAGEVEKQQ
ncbi:hypothetical protein HYH02_014809 [Chlamydomonas schloesseri]|uniref:DNA (cytosine-5-)-methyltransferase n=1 Tax=Chlamydomonas schloesseri TaxID=2026947 RepID=A0A835SV27_9CHLO|nr:hypothetical protein HYH02_014809 [Chlamydomonas schloesseri]|eukprot:KAG2426381.1 hypothetical protein HYH02_014809 [Chlamydomonas schloesseri]